MEEKVVKILVIEDNPNDVKIMTRVLAKRHYAIDFVDSGRKGLEKLSIHQYDIVISDYAMPGMTALDVLDEMGKEGYDVPMVVTTGVGSEKIAVEAMKKGAYDYVG